MIRDVAGIKRALDTREKHSLINKKNTRKTKKWRPGCIFGPPSFFTNNFLNFFAHFLYSSRHISIDLYGGGALRVHMQYSQQLSAAVVELATTRPLQLNMVFEDWIVYEWNGNGVQLQQTLELNVVLRDWIAINVILEVLFITVSHWAYSSGITRCSWQLLAWIENQLKQNHQRLKHNFMSNVFLANVHVIH